MLRVLQREAALGQRRQRVALGQPGVDEAEPLLLDAQDLRASSISFLRTSWMFFSMYASPWSFGLRMEPRSPPVQVTTSTSTPSDTYLAMVAAPLLDSSSGWA